MNEAIEVFWLLTRGMGLAVWAVITWRAGASGIERIKRHRAQRFSARLQTFTKHGEIARGRCPCSECDAFRREVGT